MLIAARAIQAIGGGGILPIATAEIGTEVPEERRGLALGLVGAVFGMANLLGASAGSLILDIAGSHNWQWIFYVNVPIAALIVIAGVLLLPNHRETTVAPLDLIGTALLVAMIMSLLYGLTNIDFFDLGGSLRSLDVWPFLLAFVVLLPVFVLAERRAADPVLNLRYFTQAPIALTLLASFLSGFILMGVVFVPQLAENALQLPSGSGGYLVIILGLASGVGAPLSGRLTDQFGPKRVLAIGASISALAAVSVIAWVIPAPGYPSVIVTLI
jgi:MFS family permease